MLPLGAMRFTILIEQRSATVDAAGEPVATWSTVISCRAALQRVDGTEVFSSAQRQVRVPTVFKLRYPRELASPISPAMRLTFNGSVYDIVSAIDPTGLRAELLITAVEQVVAS